MIAVNMICPYSKHYSIKVRLNENNPIEFVRFGSKNFFGGATANGSWDVLVIYLICTVCR